MTIKIDDLENQQELQALSEEKLNTWGSFISMVLSFIPIFVAEGQPVGFFSIGIWW